MISKQQQSNNWHFLQFMYINIYIYYFILHLILYDSKCYYLYVGYSMFYVCVAWWDYNFNFTVHPCVVKWLVVEGADLSSRLSIKCM